jgi:hypothetical protein
MEQYIYHGCRSFPRRHVGPGAATQVGSRGSLDHDPIKSDHGLVFSLEHDLFGKPASTFPDHALRKECTRFYGKTKSRELRNYTWSQNLGPKHLLETLWLNWLQPSTVAGICSVRCVQKAVRDKIRSNVHPKRTFVDTNGMSAEGRNIAAQIGNVRFTLESDQVAAT